MSGHTYDKWQKLGYQVKKGEVASYHLYGKNIFTEDQVIEVSGQSSEYHNHCWNCGQDVDSNDESQCDDCGWLSCSNCNSCKCNM